MSKSKKPLIIAVCIIIGIVLVVMTAFGILYSLPNSERNYNMTTIAPVIDSCCKIYLDDMINGETKWLDHNTNKTPEPLFPEWGDDEDIRREKAYEKTIGDALKYCGYYDEYANILDKFSVTYGHYIVYLKNSQDTSEINENISLTENTTLGEIYK